MTLGIVITTIQPPTAGVIAIARRAKERGWPLLVIGDRKSPEVWHCPGAHYYSYEEQGQLPFATAACVPPNSYTRKMIGYLLAARVNCRHIRETDDDNVPYEDFFASPPASTTARIADPINSWVNIYPYFTDRFVWPRGFPLAYIHDAGRLLAPTRGEAEVTESTIFQAVADGDPDVDAVYRMTASDLSEIRFSRGAPLLLPRGSWTPFNSQATTWPIELLPLMYLPSTCSFRMTDIWRSFIAQRLLSSFDAKLVITAATVFQERNAHDLMRDFVEEFEGYTGYERFVQVLEGVSVRGIRASVLEDLRRIFERLIDAGFFRDDEMLTLEAWLADMQNMWPG